MRHPSDNVSVNSIPDLGQANVSDRRPGLVHADAKRLAEIFHNTYEMLAPLHNYETRPESRVAWADVPPKNKILMTDVCSQLLHNGIVTLRPDLQAK